MLSNYLNHQKLYFWGLIIIAIGMPSSNVLMSIGSLWVSANWILEGKYKEKINSWWKNKAAVIFSVLFLIHVLGLLYTEDFDYGLKDLRIKLPLLALPMVFTAMNPIKWIDFEKLIFVFIGSVVVITLLSFGVYLKLIYPDRDISNVRQISVFVSHIRLCLMICLSIFFLFFFLLKHNQLWKKISYAITIIWLICFMTILESVTGFIILLSGFSLLLIISVFKQKSILLKSILISVLVVIISIPSIYIYNLTTNYYSVPDINPQTLKEHTKHGGKYTHKTNMRHQENGNYVWINICEEELIPSWNEVSQIKYYEKDKKGQVINGTILRYMTSKGLTKDQEGVEHLSQDDIQNIQSGITNVNKETGGIEKRIKQVIYELDNYITYGDPSGHSFTQRLEYWKTGMEIAKENLLFGVGTGDIKVAFDNQYKINRSKLKTEFRHRAHNQFLTFLISFGIIGLLFFLFVMVFPLFGIPKNVMNFYLMFFVTVMISFVTEDTLETQAGVTFFAFFNYFLVLVKALPAESNDLQSPPE